MNYPCIMTETSIACVIDNVPYNIDDSHPNFDSIKEAIRKELWNEVPSLSNVGRALVEFADVGGGLVSVNLNDGVVLFEGEEVHGTIVNRMLDMMSEGFDIKPMVRFLANLMLNPSKRAVDELYGFLEHGKMPITEDGYFLAYKRVNANYTSVYDGKTDNSIGATPSMLRNKVDENSEQTCSTGLHFCSHEYLKSFSGSKVVILKVNPRDVVAIPKDYNDTKGRACTYEVVGELSPDEVVKALSDSVWDMSVVDHDDRDTWNDDIDDSDDMSDVFGGNFDLNSLPHVDRCGDIIGARHHADEAQKQGHGGNQSVLTQDENDYGDGVIEGYDVGMADAKAGDMYNNIPDDETNGDGSMSDQGYHDGYESGYNDYKQANPGWGKPQGHNVLRPVDTDQALGRDQDGLLDTEVCYDLGYKDGKGHKSKRKCPYWSTPHNDAYLTGYGHGRYGESWT